MTQRLTFVVVLTTPVLLLAYLATSFAQQPGTNNAWTKLEVQYAEANLQLARARLAIAEGENAQVPDSVSAETMASLRGGVALAEGRLKSAQGGGTDPDAGYIAEAQARILGAEQKLRESQEANALDAGAVPADMVAREQAELAVAQARLAMLKVLHEQPAEVQLRWEIRQLQDEIRALWNRPLIED